jgi:hypothetical protein
MPASTTTPVFKSNNSKYASIIIGHGSSAITIQTLVASESAHIWYVTFPCDVSLFSLWWVTFLVQKKLALFSALSIIFANWQLNQNTWWLIK